MTARPPGCPTLQYTGRSSKMARSGVSIEDGVCTEFNHIKINKKYKYIQLKITDDLKRIEVEKCVESVDDFGDFVAQLPPDDCRYVVYDFCYSLGESGDRQQLLFIVWCPDSAKVRKKMLYASSKEDLKKKLVGLNLEVQATEPSELNQKELEDKFKSKSYK